MSRNATLRFCQSRMDLAKKKVGKKVGQQKSIKLMGKKAETVHC